MEVWKGSDVPVGIQNMILELIQRKQKIWKPHRYAMISFWIFVVCSFYVLIDFFIYFIGVSSNAFYVVIYYVLSGRNFILILLLSFAFACCQYYRAEEKKKEDKFERLRAEVIESIRTEWSIYLSPVQIRVILEQLKQRYRINLFFKG